MAKVFENMQHNIRLSMLHGAQLVDDILMMAERWVFTSSKSPRILFTYVSSTMPARETCHMEVWKLWPYALRVGVKNVCAPCLGKAYEIGMILIYRVGNGTPARLTRPSVNVSGAESFFRLEWRIWAMLSSSIPTYILNSFMLHGWAASRVNNCNQAGC